MQQHIPGTKAGLAEWSRAMRLELANTGVHFSTIFPGYIREVGMFAKFGMQPLGWLDHARRLRLRKRWCMQLRKAGVEAIINSRPAALLIHDQ